MATSQQLVNRWRERLGVGERLTHNASPRLRWLGQVYVRLYRFLLSVYGQGEWRSTTASPFAEDSPAAERESANQVPFVDLTEDEPGTPAKSVEQLRNTLKSVHAANSRVVEFGPLTRGLDEKCWIAIGEYREKKSRSLITALRLAGIESRANRNRRCWIIHVRYRDYEQALKLVQNHDSKPRPVSCPQIIEPTSATPTVSSCAPAWMGTLVGLLVGPLVCLMIMATLTILQVIPGAAFYRLSESTVFCICLLVIWLACVGIGMCIRLRRRPLG